MKNAFNSASWQEILAELKRREINESLLKIIASYLSERKILLEAENKIKEKSINSGVPQGSVLGPTLWNVQYDGLLELELPEGVKLIGFADDVAMVVTARSEGMLMNAADTATLRIIKWMKVRKLELAPHKTEAVLLTTRRKLSPISFKIQDVTIVPSKAIKLLGVWLDSKLNFAVHVDRTAQKAERTMTALAGLMPSRPHA